VYLARWSTLLLALLLSGPALWQTFVLHELDYTSAGIRYLIAVPVSAIMLALLRGLAGGYQSGATGPTAGGKDGRLGSAEKARRAKDSGTDK
jgi:hypothetical protein